MYFLLFCCLDISSDILILILISYFSVPLSQLTVDKETLPFPFLTRTEVASHISSGGVPLSVYAQEVERLQDSPEKGPMPPTIDLPEYDELNTTAMCLPSPAMSTSSQVSNSSEKSVVSCGTTSSGTSSVRIISVSKGDPMIFRPLDYETRCLIAGERGLSIAVHGELEYSRIGVSLIGPPRVHSIKPDGNCFFRAIAYAIQGNQTGHKRIRDLICRDIRLHGPYHAKHGGKEYVNQKKMDVDTTYATDVEIYAAAQVFKCDIFVYHTYGDQGLQWLIFKSKKSDKYSQGIYLDNRNGNGKDGHFETVLGF